MTTPEAALTAAILATRSRLDTVKLGDGPVFRYVPDREREEAEALLGSLRQAGWVLTPLAPEVPRPCPFCDHDVPDPHALHSTPTEETDGRAVVLAMRLVDELTAPYPDQGIVYRLCSDLRDALGSDAPEVPPRRDGLREALDRIREYADAVWSSEDDEELRRAVRKMEAQASAALAIDRATATPEPPDSGDVTARYGEVPEMDAGYAPRDAGIDGYAWRVEAVLGHIMRAGLVKSERVARQEAEHYVLAALTGERWDVDYDRLTEKQRRTLDAIERAAAPAEAREEGPDA